MTNFGPEYPPTSAVTGHSTDGAAGVSTTAFTLPAASSVASRIRSYEAQPSDYGFKYWNMRPIDAAAGSLAGTGGTLYLSRIKVLEPSDTITNVIAYVQTGGSTLTSGRNFAALFNSSKQLLSVTADQTTAWASAGLKIMALTAAQTVTAGLYYVGWFSNGTTPPAFSRAANAAPVNMGFSNSTGRWVTADTGLTTTMPSTAGATTLSNSAYFVALS